MTQNDIAYYNARNERRDMRLRRKESKRHDLASEKTEQTKAAASYLSAQAAAENAATNRKTYELNWESQYGYDYGTSPEDHTYMFWDLNTGEKITDSPKWEPSSRRKWLSDREGDQIIYIVGDNKYGTSNAYIQGLINISKDIEAINVQKSQETKNFWETIKTAGSTAEIIAETGETIVDTGSNLMFGKKQRNQKGGH